MNDERRSRRKEGESETQRATRGRRTQVGEKSGQESVRRRERKEREGDGERRRERAGETTRTARTARTARTVIVTVQWQG